MQPEEAAEDGPSVWAPATCVQDLDEAVGSWLQHGPVPAVEASWEVNHQTEDKFLSLPLPLSNK